MKLGPLRSWTVFATFGALVVVVVAIQQSVPGASSKNVALRPVSAAGPAARLLGNGSSGQFKASNPDTVITVQVHPVSAPVTSLVPQQFTATVKGPTNKAVTWYVDDLLGGDDTVGTIDTTGLYTPPANFAIGTHTVKAISQADNTTSGTATSYLVGYAGLYTNKNDNSRTGQNLQETVLTPQNVNVSTFGKLFSYTLDQKVQAQPLYVANVYVPQPLNGTAGYHNVLYVATFNDSVYAFDADGKVLSGPLWKDSFINPPSVVPVPGSCVADNADIMGITATPVIDPTTNTMYVVARTLEGQTTACTGTYVYRLHALDITNGQEKFGGPVVIQASVSGQGEGSVDGMLAFDSRWENSRPGMLLSQSAADANSVVYLAAASTTDEDPYHGWILGYDSQTLALTYVFCTTPDDKRGGIWQMGGGLAADADGNIYVQTGNGTFDNQTNFGESVLKLTPGNGSLTLTDYYTPNNYATLNKNDWDLSGGILLLPDQPGTYPHLMIGGGKEGTIYVMNRDGLGGYDPNGNNIAQYIVGAIKPSVAKQAPASGIWNTPSYFQGNVYINGQFDYPKMFTLNNGVLPTTATSTGTITMKSPAAIISANGTQDGIVWLFQYETSIPTLYAFNPNDLTQEYYDTNQNPRDKISSRKQRRVNPTVANGRVYVPTNSQIKVYGLLP
jgi:hypothetical protein